MDWPWSGPVDRVRRGMKRSSRPTTSTTPPTAAAHQAVAGGDLEVRRDPQDASQTPGEQAHLVVPHRQGTLQPVDRDEQRDTAQPQADAREHGPGRTATTEGSSQRPAGRHEQPAEQRERDGDVGSAPPGLGPEGEPVAARAGDAQRHQGEQAAQQAHAREHHRERPHRGAAAQQHRGEGEQPRRAQGHQQVRGSEERGLHPAAEQHQERRDGHRQHPLGPRQSPDQGGGAPGPGRRDPGGPGCRDHQPEGQPAECDHEQPPGRPRHGPVAHCPVDTEAGRGQVPGRVQQVALVAAQVFGRALLVVPVGRLPGGVRPGRAGVVPLRGAQEHRPVRRQQPKGVDLVVERPEEIGARLGSAPGGLVGRRDQGAHAPGGVDGGLTVGDRLREPVVDHGVDQVEGRGVTGEDVPLEEPHLRWRLEAEGCHALLGERTQVEPSGDRLPGQRQGLDDGAHRGRVLGEVGARPVDVELTDVRGGVAGQGCCDAVVLLVERPVAGLQVQRHRTRAPRAAVLRPAPHALDVRVLGEQLLHRPGELRPEVVGEGAEPLELPTRLELHDASLAAGLQRAVQRQPAVEVARDVLGGHDQRRGVEAVQHLLVGGRIGVHVTHGTDPDAPGAEHHFPVRLLGLTGERRQHPAHGRNGAHGQLRVVVPARLGVDAPTLTDPDQDAGQPRRLAVQLFKRLGVDPPEPRVGGLEAAEGPLEVALQGGREGEHVGAQVDLHTELAGALPERREGLAQRLRPGDVRVTGSVDRAVGCTREVGVLDEPGPRHGVVPVGERLAQERLPVAEVGGERTSVDVRRGRQVGVLEGPGGVRVVGARAPLRRVRRDADRAQVDHPERQPAGDRASEVLGHRTARPGGAGEVVDAADRTGLAGCPDRHRAGCAAEPVGVVPCVGAATDLHRQRRAAVGLVLALGVAELLDGDPQAHGAWRPDHQTRVDGRRRDHGHLRCGRLHLFGAVVADAQGLTDPDGDTRAQCQEQQPDDRRDDASASRRPLDCHATNDRGRSHDPSTRPFHKSPIRYIMSTSGDGDLWRGPHRLPSSVGPRSGTPAPRGCGACVAPRPRVGRRARHRPDCRSR